MPIERRTLLKRAVGGVNALIGVIVAVPAVRYLFDPVWKARKDAAFIRVLPLSALTPDQPARVNVIAERQDAYTHYPPGAIGNVFLIREDKGGEPAVRCLQVICPHLGCAIEYLSDRAEGSFGCPCHASDFDKAGRRRAGPAPRNMDSLECRITGPDATGQHWVEVKYQEFQTGIAEKHLRT